MHLRLITLFLAICIPFLSVAYEVYHDDDDDDEELNRELEEHYALLDSLEFELPEGYELASCYEDDSPDVFFDDDDDDDEDEDYEDYDDEFFWPRSKGSSEKDTSVPEMSYFETLPALMVGGCVNALSGYFVESGTDLMTPGPKPLVVQRSWSSKEKKWHFGHMPNLQVGFSKSGNHIEAGYQDDTGSGMHLRGPTRLAEVDKPRKTLRISPKTFKKGLTNCGLGEISGQTNLKNTFVRYMKKKDKKHLVLRHGTHVDRIFGIYKTKGVQEGVKCGKYRLEEEHDPTGNSLYYKYKNHNKLYSILAYNNAHKLLHAMTYKESSSSTNRVWNSPSGEVSYYFKPYLKKPSLRNRFPKDLMEYKLLKIQSSQEVPIAYTYDLNHRISDKTLPDGRSVHIEYFDHGDNKDKVRLLKSPIGPFGALETTHTFSYYKDLNDKHIEHTSVTDAMGHKTHYVQRDKRLFRIFKYEGSTLISKEEFSWNSAGNLLERTFEEHGKIVLQKKINYDSFGNITHEILTGNLTGSETQDSFVKTYASSQGGWNLPLKEQDGELTIVLSYKPKTNLLKSRLTLANDSILKREFFEYDASGVLTLEILDDGNSENPDDLSSVTERHLKKITPTSAFPFGLPEKTEEFCLDLPSATYIPLKTTVARYSITGQKLKEEHYGSNHLLAFTLEWEYDHLGNLISEKDALGNTVRYYYDANCNKIQESRAELTKYFTYDTTDRLITQKEIWQDGTTLTTTNRYNLLGHRIASIDHQGDETLYSYDALGNLVETIHPPLIGSTYRSTEKWTFDALGNKLTHTDPNGNVTKTRYTIRGQPCRIEYPDGSIEIKEYASNGRLIKEIAKNGLETIYTRDPFGRIINTSFYDASKNFLKSTSATYNTFHLLSETDEEGYVTNYSYDSAGHKATQQKENQLTHYVYDYFGRPDITIERLNEEQSRVTTLIYDPLNHVIEKRIEEKSGEIFKKELYDYDSLGNRNKITTFTENGPSISRSSFTPHKKPYYEQDALGNETFTTYDYFFPYEGSLVLKVTRIDPLGNKVVTLFDSHGNKLQQSRLDLLDNLLQQETHKYDLCHRLTSTTSLNGVTTTWEYDAMGNEVRCIEANEKITAHTFNTFGQKTTTLTPNGITLLFEYDAFGRLSSQKSSDQKIHYSFNYDKKDHLLSAQNNVTDTATYRSYDPLGRITSETLETNLKISYLYDNLDRITLITLPDESSILYTYNACRLLTVERIKDDIFTYYHSYLAYNLSGQPTLEELINGEHLTRHYDPLNRPLSIKTPLREEHLTYDKVGNLITRTVTDPENTIISNFSYDALYQLTEETGFAYRYDTQSNRIAKNDIAYSVNALNQVTFENNSTYKYDNSGNLIEKDTTLYKYDPLNRLIEVIDPNFHASYTYDAFHRRLTKTVNDVSEQYLYQNDCEIGDQKNLRILGRGFSLDIGATVAIELENKHYAPLHNSSGSIVLLLDSSNMPHSPFNTTAFGEPLSPTPQNPWLYSSKRFDPETGFFYFGRRYFSPNLGRWITPDPAGFEDGLNLYAYVHNSPLTHIDPDGQFAFLIPIAIHWGVCLALEYSLPILAAAVEEYAGGTVAAAVLSGVVNGYTGNYGLETLAAEVSLSEQIGVTLGAVLSLNPRKITTTTVTNIAKSQFTKNIGNKVCSKITNSCATTARANAGKVTQTVEKVAKTAGKSGIAKESVKKLASDDHIWTRASPFKNKSAKELDAMFKQKGYTPFGKDPLNGKGSFVNPANGRQYHIDPQNIGRYREPNHVDIGRPEGYNGFLGKKRFGYLND